MALAGGSPAAIAPGWGLPGLARCWGDSSVRAGLPLICAIAEVVEHFGLSRLVTDGLIQAEGLPLAELIGELLTSSNWTCSRPLSARLACEAILQARVAELVHRAGLAKHASPVGVVQEPH
jgi:hypothetical protein